MTPEERLLDERISHTREVGDLKVAHLWEVRDLSDAYLAKALDLAANEHKARLALIGSLIQNVITVLMWAIALYKGGK